MQQDPIKGKVSMTSSELTEKAQESRELAEAAREAGDMRSARVHEWNARRLAEAVEWRLRDRPSE